MKMNSMKRMFAFIGCIVLIAAMALNLTGCVGKKDQAAEGSLTYSVVMTDLEGKETTVEVTTDKKTVGEELLARGLIAGDPGEYGLYVKTVNGITLDWDKDGKYWAFYIDGEYATTGVDSTNAVNGAVYAFKPE